MKRQKRYLFIGVIMASLFLSGCGTQLYEMTKEEEELIVHSAAYFVAKHNIQQKDGVSAVVDIDSIVLEDETESIENVDEPETELADGTVISPDGSEAEGTQVDDSIVTLAQAVGHESDLSILYNGSYVADNYVEGEAYSIDAAEGKTFYIMKFIVINTTEEDVLLDNVTLNPLFKLVSSDVNVKAEVTFLTTDFSTYLGTIPAGTNVETILLFEIPEAQAEQVSTAILQITADNVTKKIKL